MVEAVGVLASVAWPTEAGVIRARQCWWAARSWGSRHVGLVRARALSPDDPRRVLALMTSAFGLGQILGPLFAGLVAERLGSFAVPSAAAVVALLGAAGLVLKRDS